MLDVDDLQKTFHGTKGRQGAAVDQVSFNVLEGELFTLLGPSGCGKTTTLRSIAGLESPDGGRIQLGGVSLLDHERHVNVPAEKRGLGMVFQSYAIWPHMTVLDNVAFPLRSRRERLGNQHAKDKAREALRIVELEDFADRPAPQLSGGQQQRLALARAIALEPKLLLLDEPLSNLDARLRDSMRLELKRVQRELGITSVYVTHDQTEALAMSNKIAVMKEGKIVQIGSPREIYEEPNSSFVASFVGRTNLLEGVLVSGNGRLLVSTNVGTFLTDRVDGSAGETVWVSIRPETIEIADLDIPREPLRQNERRGRIAGRAYAGESMTYVIDVGSRNIEVSARGPQFHVNDEVLWKVEPEAVTIVPRSE